MEAGDILLAVNDEPINSREFIILVSSLEPGAEVVVMLKRSGSELSLKPILAPGRNQKNNFNNNEFLHLADTLINIMARIQKLTQQL